MNPLHLKWKFFLILICSVIFIHKTNYISPVFASCGVPNTSPVLCSTTCCNDNLYYCDSNANNECVHKSGGVAFWDGNNCTCNYAYANDGACPSDSNCSTGTGTGSSSGGSGGSGGTSGTAGTPYTCGGFTITPSVSPQPLPSPTPGTFSWTGNASTYWSDQFSPSPSPAFVSSCGTINGGNSTGGSFSCTVNGPGKWTLGWKNCYQDSNGTSWCGSAKCTCSATCTYDTYYPFTCTNTSPGSNMLTGCIFNGINFTAVAGNAPPGVLQTAPVADNPSTSNVLNYNWNNGAPSPAPYASYIGSSNFSIRWKGSFKFKPGNYTFSVGSDDGSRLYLDDNLILNHWSECCTTWSSSLQTFSINDSLNSHILELDYNQGGGGNWVNLSWSYTPLIPTITTVNNLDCSGSPSSPNNAISWTGSSTDAYYDVYRSTSAGGTYTPIGTNIIACQGTPTTNCSFTDSTATAGITYYYQVDACNNSSSCSSKSSYASVITFNCASLPTVTTNSASVGSCNSGNLTRSVTLNGSANPNGASTTGYFRYRTTSSSTCSDADTWGIRVPSSSGTSLGSGTTDTSCPGTTCYSQTITPSTSTTPYYYCAIASNSVGTGLGSPPVPFTVSSCIAPWIQTTGGDVHSNE